MTIDDQSSGKRRCWWTDCRIVNSNSSSSKHKTLQSIPNRYIGLGYLVLANMRSIIAPLYIFLTYSELVSAFKEPSKTKDHFQNKPINHKHSYLASTCFLRSDPIMQCLQRNEMMIEGSKNPTQTSQCNPLYIKQYLESGQKLETIIAAKIQEPLHARNIQLLIINNLWLVLSLNIRLFKLPPCSITYPWYAETTTFNHLNLSKTVSVSWIWIQNQSQRPKLTT